MLRQVRWKQLRAHALTFLVMWASPLSGCGGDVVVSAPNAASSGAPGDVGGETGTSSSGGSGSGGGAASTAGTRGYGGYAPLPGGSAGPWPGTCADEAVENVFAIAGAAAQAFNSTGTTCLTAHPIPLFPLPGPNFGYMPMSSPGYDFQTGDTTTGWRCLGFSIATPIHCQYHYNRGRGYVAPEVGGPAPNGTEGFEVAAVGDDDGDGRVYSLFTIAGSVENSELTMSNLFVHQSGE